VNIYINKKEAELLLKAIHELQHVVEEMELEEEGSSGYTPYEMVNTNTLKLKIKNAMAQKKREARK
tara:strand:- start:4967 stop:5164 length:198 start_codon:yes stop_codon:yes gene_type:complete